MTLSVDIEGLIARWRKSAERMREHAELRWANGQSEESTKLNLYADLTESYATELEQVAQNHTAATAS